MPLLKLQVSELLPSTTRDALMKDLSALTARTIGKPENYVMVEVGQSNILMGGTSGPAALVEVRSIGGLTPQVNKALAKSICDLLKAKAQIPPERVFVNFLILEPTHWGWRGDTFA